MRQFLFLFLIFLSLVTGPLAAPPETAPEVGKSRSLFSRIETLNHLTHTINPGDTLAGLAKKYGTTVELLRKNNGVSRDKIYAGMKLKVPTARFSIVVDRQTNRLLVLADDKPLKRYKVATGRRDRTPPGAFKIINKLENPTWYNAGTVVPPDSPKNILGTRWMGFDKSGYGIHGTTLPETIGTYSSKGCIRMLNSEVEELYTIIPLGTQVLVKE